MTEPHRTTRLRPAATIATAVAAIVTLAGPSNAHDDEHKRLSSDRMKMRWSASDGRKAQFVYKTKHQLRISDLSVNPATAGASLTVRGTGTNDGSPCPPNGCGIIPGGLAVTSVIRETPRSTVSTVPTPASRVRATRIAPTRCATRATCWAA